MPACFGPGLREHPSDAHHRGRAQPVFAGARSEVPPTVSEPVYRHAFKRLVPVGAVGDARRPTGEGMTVTIVVGGQYGSEGKGKVVALEARRAIAPCVVRCGGPNSGHTVHHRGKARVLRQVPAGVVNPESLLLLGPGCAIDPEVLAEEVEALGVRDRIVVDPRAVVIEAKDRLAEAQWSDAIGSTATGTGAALIRRMQRTKDVVLAAQSELVRSVSRVESVSAVLQAHLDRGGDVIVEGTQGFGLSILHGKYPFVTARDTTAAGFASEAGIAPQQVTRVVMVLRTFPIRVGGPSGPMTDEISWEEVQKRGGAPSVVPEYTSVTHRLRRVSLFDWELAERAAKVNRPTSVALMGLDRLEYSNTNAASLAALNTTARKFLDSVSSRLKAPVGWVGTGFEEQAFRLGET